MALESAVQWWLHNIEQGRLAKWTLRILVATSLTTLTVFWLVAKFNGFAVPEAMDQAQIGRQIASGQGFTTLYARPLALGVLAQEGRLRTPLPEVSNAPLGPLVNAAVFRATGMNFSVSRSSFISAGDFAIASTGIVFLLGGLLVAYALGRVLFEPRLALLGTGLVACTALLWRFATSGLPQPAMLVLFNSSLLALALAMRAADQGRTARSLMAVMLAAFLLGCTTLGNGLGLWMFPGFLLFAVAALHPRRLVAAGCTGAYLLPLLPWVWHNWRALGHPFGLAFLELRRPAGTEKLAFMADLEPDLSLHWSDILQNIAAQGLHQIDNLFAFLGHNVVAVAFLLAVLFHTFRKWHAAQFRWAILLMWVGAVAGMSVGGVDAPVSINQLHILFLPVMIFYGLGFLLVLWARLGLEQPMLRVAFIAALYATVAAPLLVALTSPVLRFNWPPYVPPVMQNLGEWIGPDEALGTDVPWATAWYAGRRSLLLPESVAQFELIGGERALGAPLVAIYLTPATADARTYSDIVAGRYGDWARLILRETVSDENDTWPLGHRVALPIDGGSVLFADRPRWKE